MFYVEEKGPGAVRRVFWSAVWLAVTLVATKSYYLGLPEPFTVGGVLHYPLTLAAVSYADVLFVAGWWACGRVAISCARRWPLAVRACSLAFAGASAVCCLFAVVNVLVFGVFGGFLSYPLLALVGDVRMVRSSIGAYVTPWAVVALVGVPVAYVGAVAMTLRLAPARRGQWWPRTLAVAALAIWVVLGRLAFDAEWRGRPDRRIAANSQWVFLVSWVQAVSGGGVLRMPDQFPAGDLADFEPNHAPLGAPPPALRRASAALAARATAARRPPNVILVVLESVAARWTSVNGGPYSTTPTLAAESARAVVFDHAYAHIGRSSNSLVAMLLSTYPKLDFREITEQFPDLPGTSLATVFRDRGYHTAFMTPSDMSWAGWDRFLEGRGFADVRDHHDLSSCPELLSSWGVEDRCMVDAMVEFVEKERTRPFFLMAWTTQTHQPYEMSPGVPELDLLREPTPDDWELSRYLNILHETDNQLRRVFDVVRRTGLEEDTLIVVTGDHGQAFGYPHENVYIQGGTVYEEDVNVPLIFWFPRAYRSTVRSKTIAGQVDLAPTIAEMAGVPAAPDWQGRSLFDTRQPHRAYFYVAEDSFTLGVRDENWKYIYDLRDGTEELYDLDRDPTEQRNLATNEPERCARLRQRLAAWAEANRRQYEKIAESGRSTGAPPASP